MSGYVDLSLDEFLRTSDADLLSSLHRAYAADGFATQYTTATTAWDESIALIRSGLESSLKHLDNPSEWRVILEFPLYRLRKRIDLLLVLPEAVVVIELKVGETRFSASDMRQAEEYALDLRDFHETSAGIPLVPVLWSTAAESVVAYPPALRPGVLEPVVTLGREDFPGLVRQLAALARGLPARVREDWADGAYRPVPSVIDAATTMFAGHGVEEITRADAANLAEAATEVLRIVEWCRKNNRKGVVFLTGVPGSGKTLAGLQVVYDAVGPITEEKAEVVYLSGNTPLVVVLQQALIEDDYARRREAGERVKKKDVEDSVKAKVQHIMDFLREYLQKDDGAPFERAIVFDEAQRAWNETQGKSKFGREASEPRLLLDIMDRHDGWAAVVGLIGSGQEINSGERGLAEWGDALRSLPPGRRGAWRVFGPPEMVDGDRTDRGFGLGPLAGVRSETRAHLALTVPLRSFRSPKVANWVAEVLDGDAAAASDLIADAQYPIHLTRDAASAEQWLERMGRGERRYGLVATSTARRLRAEGYGVTLSASDQKDIAHWYLRPRGDVRSSFALEIVANEYTTQGLELDYVGLLWGGDLLRGRNGWDTRSFAGTRWQAARGDPRRFILNSYRVLMTRAREGMVIWVPSGDPDDPTRDPRGYDQTAHFLLDCGATALPSTELP